MKERMDIELVKGAIDIHVHSSPSTFHRQETEIIVRNAREMGVRGLILKSHHHPTIDRATYVGSQLPGIDIFHSITLNFAVGGINPFAVDIALKMGAKCVWMPTIDSVQQKNYYGSLGGYGSKQSFKIPEIYKRVQGISILDDKGGLIPDVLEIIDMVKYANCILAVGHLTNQEIRALVKAAKEKNFKKLVVDHPHFPFCEHSLNELRDLVNDGATLNFTFSELSPKWYAISAEEIAAQINELGSDHIVLSSDTGQVHNPLPAESLRVFYELLIEENVPYADIYRMSHETPARLVYE